MIKIKTIAPLRSIVGTAFFTFLLCCSAIAMEPYGERKKFMRKPSVNNDDVKKKAPSFSLKLSDVKQQTTLLSGSPTAPTFAFIKDSEIKPPLTTRFSRGSKSEPTSPCNSPRRNELAPSTDIPRKMSTPRLNRSQTANSTSCKKKTSDHIPDLDIPSPYPSHEPEVISAKTSDRVIASRSKSVSSESGRMRFSQPSSPTLPRTAASPVRIRSITSSGGDQPQTNTAVTTPRKGSNSSLISPSTSPRDESPRRPRQLSIGNSHATLTPRSIYSPRFFHNFNDKLVDVLDNVMNKPSVFGCVEDLQHLRWKFYCSIKDLKGSFNFQPSKIINDIKYVYDIKTENLLDEFWNNEINKNLNNEELIVKIKIEDLELIAKSIEFFIDSEIKIEKLFLYESALLCYQRLFQLTCENKRKNIYHYEIAKYATLTGKYAAAYPHFLEGIHSDHLDLAQDFKWLSCLSTMLLPELENRKTNGTLNKAGCYFEIARLKENWQKIIEVSKPRVIESPATADTLKVIQPDEFVLFYEEVLYCKFFDKPKMEVDSGAVTLFLSREKALDESSSSGEIFSLDLDANNTTYTVSDLIDHINKTSQGRVARFTDKPSPDKLSAMKQNELLFFYENVPYCKLAGKPKRKITFDVPSSGLTEDCFNDLMRSLSEGNDIAKDPRTAEGWDKLKVLLSTDSYNVVLNENVEKGGEPDPEVAELYLKSAFQHYKNRNLWDSINTWEPHTLFAVAHEAYDTLQKNQEKNVFNKDGLEEFYYHLIEFIGINNGNYKSSYNKEFENIITKFCEFKGSVFSADLMIKRGKSFATLGKTASNLRQIEEAERLCSEAAILFYKHKYPLESYKELENDMIAISISHILQQNDSEDKMKLIKGLSFYLVRDKRYQLNDSSKRDLYEKILNYLYTSNTPVACYNFAKLFPFSFPFSKGCWEQYFQEITPQYANTQRAKKDFFENALNYLTRLIKLNEKPNEKALEIFEGELIQRSIFNRVHWNNLKKLDNDVLKAYISTLESVAGLEKSAYQDKEEGEYQDLIFKTLDLESI